MFFQKKVDEAMRRLHESSDEAEAERKREFGESYEPMERPELEKGDMLAMLIAAFLTFIPAAILIFGVIFAVSYFLLHH